MMGKVLGYAALGVLALIGLGSVFGINHATSTMAQANADVAAAEAKHPEVKQPKTWTIEKSPTQADYADDASDTEAEYGEGTDPTPVDASSSEGE